MTHHQDYDINIRFINNSSPVLTGLISIVHKYLYCQLQGYGMGGSRNAYLWGFTVSLCVLVGVHLTSLVVSLFLCLEDRQSWLDLIAIC